MMTSKEAFNELKREISVRGNLSTFQKRCFDIIQQDLDRLEQLEKIFGDKHICEIKARFNEIECDADKCDNCPLAIGDDLCFKIIFEDKWKLQEENEELREKQTPKKVFFLNYGGYKIGNWKCPVCDKIVHRGEDYCINCGQALDWSEEDE